MRIAIIVEHVHTRGGQERVVAELVRRLCERHEIHLYCFAATDIPTDRVHVHRLPPLWGSAIVRSLWIALLAGLLVRRRRFDIVLSQGGNALNPTAVLVHTCHGLRTQAVRTGGRTYEAAGRLGRIAWAARRWWATLMEGRAVRRCRGRVIAVSQTLKDYLIRQHGLWPNEVHVANNGVDHDVFNPAARAKHRADMRAELGLAEGHFAVLFVGGMWHGKGLASLIEAVSLMRHEPVRLIVVGRGDVAEFSGYAARHGITDAVTFCPPTDRIARYYAAADAFAFLSETEGFGLVAAEAAACGLPVVMTRVGIADELIEDGVSGYLVGRAPSLVADRLDRLAADPELARNMGQRAHQRALRLTWEGQAAIIEGLFEQWSGKRQARGSSISPDSDAGRAAEGACTPPRGERFGGRPDAAAAGHDNGESTAKSSFALQESRRERGARAPQRRPLRLAVISHSCVIPTNQGVYRALAAGGEIQPLVIAPLRWWSVIDGPITFSAETGLDGAVWPLPVHFVGHIHLHWYARHIQHVLARLRPDVLLVDEEPYSLCGAQGLALAERLGCKLIASTKENIPRRFPPPFGAIERRVLRRADHVIVVARECEQIVRLKGYEGAVTEVPHGIDPALFRPRRDSPLRRRLGLTRPVIGYVGRLSAAKGIMDLAEAAQMARRSGSCPPFHLLFIGDGPLHERLGGRAITHQAAAHGAAGGAHDVVLVNSVPHEAVPDYLNCLDALVLPSRTTRGWREQFGRVIVEALACGTPVIGSSSGHIPYLIEDTGGGIVFPEGDVAGLATAITRMLTDREFASTCAQRGRQRVLETYTWQGVAATLRAVVEGVMG